jgi:hypothetical protein
MLESQSSNSVAPKAGVNSTLSQLLQIVEATTKPDPKPWHSLLAHGNSRKEIQAMVRDLLKVKVPDLVAAPEAEINKISSFLETRLYSSANSFEE